MASTQLLPPITHNEYNGPMMAVDMHNNNSMNFTDARRKYPLNTIGHKSEWVAMVHHQQEINDDLTKNERDIRQLRQKELLTELDTKVLQHLQEKQQELLQRQREAQAMMQKKHAYDEEVRKFKEEKAVLQNQIANTYDQQKKMQLQKDMDMRQQKLEWEYKLLEENRQRLESEAHQRKQHKVFLAHQANEDLRRSEMRHQTERQQADQNKQEHQELMRRNAEKEIIKEENYKNFYRMCAENQTSLQKIHYDHVMAPLLERERQLKEIIDKNVNEYQRRMAQEEMDRLQKRKSELLRTNEVNVDFMHMKEHQKEVDKGEKDRRVKERLDDLQQYNQYLEYKKHEKARQQNDYKDFLDKQARERHDIEKHGYRMTKHEKKLNVMDLQAYKVMDPSQFHMLPGWSPQIGQLPPKQAR